MKLITSIFPESHQHSPTSSKPHFFQRLNFVAITPSKWFTMPTLEGNCGRRPKHNSSTGRFSPLSISAWFMTKILSRLLAFRHLKAQTIKRLIKRYPLNRPCPRLLLITQISQRWQAFCEIATPFKAVSGWA